MEDNESESIVTSLKKEIRKRSFVCHVIQSMALTYFLIFALLFLAGLLFSNTVADALRPYYGAGFDMRSHYNWFIITGTVLFMMSSAGIIIFMLKQKIGFYLFLISCVITLILDLSFLHFDWLRYLIQSGFIFLLGIAHFSGKCYR